MCECVCVCVFMYVGVNVCINEMAVIADSCVGDKRISWVYTSLYYCLECVMAINGERARELN